MEDICASIPVLGDFLHVAAEKSFARNVVAIFTARRPSYESDYTYDQVGSGSIISGHGHVLTFLHVVPDFNISYFAGFQSNDSKYKIEILATDRAMDLAVGILHDLVTPSAVPYFRLTLPKDRRAAFCAGFRSNTLQVTPGTIFDTPRGIHLTNVSDNGVSGGPGTAAGQLRGLLGIVADGGDAQHHTMTRLIPATTINTFLLANAANSVPQMEVA